jgi:hypothetical protein
MDIYDWKDLDRTGILPVRGRAGFYITPAYTVPASTTKAVMSSIIIPTSDRLDAFARWVRLCRVTGTDICMGRNVPVSGVCFG